MNPRSFLALGLLVLLSGPSRAQNPFQEALDENSALVKQSSDHRLKATLLYIGPISDPNAPAPFVLVYFIDDLRSDEEYNLHKPSTLPDGEPNNQLYALTSYTPELKNGAGDYLTETAGERVLTYKETQTPAFKAAFPQVKVPVPAHPDRAVLREYYYTAVTKGPYDMVIHDGFDAYPQDGFHFHGIDADSFTTH